MSQEKIESDDRFTSYHWKLLFFLSVATFFEGYDFIAITQILDPLLTDFGYANSKKMAGVLLTVINLGTILAFLMVRKADSWGRKRVLTVTILFYTVFTFASGLAPNIWVFAIFQMIARVFLMAEFAVSMVMAAEEYPAKKRGLMIGIMQGCSTLGSIVCAGIVPMLLQTEYGWRTVYFVGIIPLVLLAYARRGLRETSRFHKNENKGPSGLAAIWASPYKKRLLMLAAIWFVSYIPVHNAVSYWKLFALSEYGLTESQAGNALALAALGSMPMVYASGWLLDVIGRKIGSLVIFGFGSIGILGAFYSPTYPLLVISLVFAIFLAAAYLPILNSYTTELFPTEYRGAAYAWANNILGRMSYVISPLIVSIVADKIGFADTIAYTLVFNILTVILIWAWLPETKSQTLEETASL